MQNYDFAKFDSGNRRNYQLNPPGRSNQRFIPNSDFYGRRSGGSGEKKSKFYVIYLVIVFTLLGFSAGIISGLFLVKNKLRDIKILHK